MTANQAMFPLSTMCKSFGVSRAGYYAWLGREPSARSLADAELTVRIKAIHKASRETGACPRLDPGVRHAYTLNSSMEASMSAASVSNA